MIAAPGSSLILSEEAEQERADSQLSLFFAGNIQVDRGKPKFHCTGERLFRDRPEIYRLVVEMLAEARETVSIRQIERVCHVTDDTIKAVAAREQIPIAARKRVIGNIAARVSQMTAERLEELAPTMNARDAAVAFGITADKTLLYNGDATVRIETGPGGNVFERMQELHARLAALVSERVANAREIPAEMGFGAENALTKGLADLADLEERADVETAGGDSESGVSPTYFPRVAGDTAESGAESDQDRPEIAGLNEGGEGVEISGRGPDALMGNAPDDLITKGGPAA